MDTDEYFLPEDADEQQFEAEVRQWERDPEYEAWLDQLEKEHTCSGKIMAAGISSNRR